MEITQNCLINNMPEAVYHKDPCPEPSLSSSMCSDLLTMTENEARENSQRLNPDYEESESTKAADLGTIAHDYVLKGGQDHKVYEIAPVDAWRSNDAKAVKADIESRGLIALNDSTKSMIKTVHEMRDRLLEQLDKHTEYAGILRKGKGEVSGFAHDGKIWNRIRIDWLDEHIPDLIVDYKTTALSFSSWEKNQLWGEGGARYLQWAHYRKVYKDITGRDATFVFVVQKTTKPYTVKVFTIDKSYEEEVMLQYDLARMKFHNALKTGQWRDEPPYTAHSCPPPWVTKGWEDAQLTQEFLQNQENLKSAQEPQDLTAAG